MTALAAQRPISWTRSGAAAKNFVALAGAALQFSSGASAEPLVMPPQLVGAWGQPSCDGPASKKATIEFSGTVALLREGFPEVPGEGRLVALRAITATRWYVDLTMSDGARMGLDINIIGGERLLVAVRPLGEAQMLMRCKT